MYLAMGFLNSLDWSVHVSEKLTPSGVAQSLSDAMVGSSCCNGETGLWPEQILMIKNGLTGPETFNRYFAGMHYPHEGQEGFTSWEERHVTPQRS